MQILVHGAGSPELPLRVLNLLAQQDAILTRAAIDLHEQGYRMTLDVTTERAERIVDKIGAMVLVSAVEIVGVQAAASPCRLISESISPSSALEQTPSTRASSHPSATT